MNTNSIGTVVFMGALESYILPQFAIVVWQTKITGIVRLAIQCT